MVTGDIFMGSSIAELTEGMEQVANSTVKTYFVIDAAEQINLLGVLVKGDSDTAGNVLGKRLPQLT